MSNPNAFPTGTSSVEEQTVQHPSVKPDYAPVVDEHGVITRMPWAVEQSTQVGDAPAPAAEQEIITEAPWAAEPYVDENRTEAGKPVRVTGTPSARAIGLPPHFVRGPQLGSFRKAPQATPDTITQVPWAPEKSTQVGDASVPAVEQDIITEIPTTRTDKH